MPLDINCERCGEVWLNADAIAPPPQLADVVQWLKLRRPAEVRF
jgi:hypothetical protein